MGKEKKIMQLTKIDLDGKFMTLVKADMHDGDDIEITKIYPNRDYKKISSILIILQDVYEKRDELERDENHDRELYIGDDLDQCILKYFKEYAETDIQSVNKAAIDYLMGEIYHLLPYLSADIANSSYPNYINHIRFLGNGQLYECGRKQPEDVIKQAKKGVISWLKSKS